MITANGLIQLGYTPEVDFSLQNDGGDTYIKSWMSGDAQPTVSAIEAAEVEWQTEYDSKQYARDRASAYPSLAEQADMAYWDRQNGTTTLDDAISAVKLQFPKG